MAGVLTQSWGGGPIDSIEKVADALRALRDAAATAGPHIDGIAAFSQLYEIITRNVLETAKGTGERRFRDPKFLTELDVQFARRYLDAIRLWESDDRTTPSCWEILFDGRGAGRGAANYAACGVNAHVNFDLAFALLETWRTFEPTPGRKADYDLVNEIFKEEMDRLREVFPTELALVDDDGSFLDRFGNFASSVLVTWTRRLAWEAAAEVWEEYDGTRPDGGEDYRQAYRRLERRLDAVAHLTGRWLLDLDRIP